jgi:hypothetical protein
MTEVEFIKTVEEKEFNTIKEAKLFYEEMIAVYEKFNKKQKEKIINSMCLEMLERITR